MDKETKKRFKAVEKRLNYLDKQFLKELKKIKKALEKVCRYKSKIPLFEIGRENLTNDIDQEVIPLIYKLIKNLKLK